MINDANDRTKKRKRYSSITSTAKKMKRNNTAMRRNDQSVREKIRKLTGQDPKNRRYYKKAICL